MLFFDGVLLKFGLIYELNASVIFGLFYSIRFALFGGLRPDEISQGPWTTSAHPDDVILRLGPHSKACELS